MSRADLNEIVITEDLRARFWAKVDKTDGCWIWRGAMLRGGYGQFQVQRPKRGPRKAHAISLLIAGERIDPARVIDHMCRQPSCVRPDHLRQVTARDNTLKNSAGPAARNQAKTHCIRGHDFSPENTRLSGPDRRHRTCRACHRAHIARYKKEGRYA